MTDWSTVGVAAITAGAALAGAIGSQIVAARRAVALDDRRADRESRRDRFTACVDLLAELDRLWSAAGGATLAGQGLLVDSNMTKDYLPKVTATEMAVTSETWAKIQPLVTATNWHLNSVNLNVPQSMRDAALKSLRGNGVEAAEAHDALREQFMLAVRREFGLD